ncbi:MAG: hypothetical protein KAR01_12945 [Desulfocapsa sp.]|nr:hypothetical protein [Desulfocapsa sp.]
MENSIRQEQIESFGRLMAGFAHDMKNHLGIIRESNGLMGDIIEMGTMCEDAKMVERLLKSIAAIERRIVISAKMMHDLSGIAHRPDTPHSSFLLNDLIEEEYTFLERFSRLKQVEVLFELQETLLPVYNDPALLQHIFYRVYAQCLDCLESGKVLTIKTEQAGKNVVASLHFSPGDNMGETEKIINEKLLAAAEKINGGLVRVEHGPDSVEIRLTVPSLEVDGTS